MAGLTRSNIAYDLSISPHQYVVIYENQAIRYVFSSDLYKKKFMEKVTDNRQSINLSLSNRFGFQINLDMLSDLKLYTAIEKRGFLIYIIKEGREWPIRNAKSITLDGNNLIMMN